MQTKKFALAGTAALTALALAALPAQGHERHRLRRRDPGQPRIQLWSAATWIKQLTSSPS
ncbi:hypothetical protein ABZW49_24455 [Nonomuraea wenchangensis]